MSRIFRRPSPAARARRSPARLTLHLHWTLRAERPLVAGRGGTHAVPEVRATRAAQPPVTAAPVGLATPWRAVTRAMSRPGDPGPSTAARGAWTAGAPPVRRVVRRPPASGRGEGERTPASRATEDPRRIGAPPAAAHELPMAEVHRLTDHVLRALDRRVGAFRERLGRA